MKHSAIRRLIPFLALSLLFAASAAAQEPTPVYKGYKGVMIGMPMEEARSALGSARDRSDTQDLYVYSDKETVQVFYDPDKTVSAVSITFTGNFEKAPEPKAVFGEEVKANPDGGIFKMVRYPKAGFWISYNKLVGDDTMILIAMKKI